MKEQNVGSVVVHQNCLNFIELDALKSILQSCQNKIVTVEDHQVNLGFGSFVTHQLVQAGYAVQVKSLGVHGQFGQSAYNAIDLYRKHKMDSSAIVDAAKSLLG